MYAKECPSINKNTEQILHDGKYNDATVQLIYCFEILLCKVSNFIRPRIRFLHNDRLKENPYPL